jgi:hypothetical protein
MLCFRFHKPNQKTPAPKTAKEEQKKCSSNPPSGAKDVNNHKLWQVAPEEEEPRTRAFKNTREALDSPKRSGPVSACN